MDSAHDVPDPTDWLNTPLSAFASLESALHCQICKEFYDTPMITSCSHTFCSKCIRTSLSSDGKCPACRTSDQASKLRNNWALQEVVATFLSARPTGLKIARQEQEAQAQRARPGKRKRIVVESDEGIVAEGEARTTRSKSRRIAASQTSEPEAIEIEDDTADEDGEYSPTEQPVDDGLVECPLGCGKRMKIEQVEPHLDRCEDEQKQAAARSKSRTPVNGFGSARAPPRHQQQTTSAQDRLAELNYSLLKENAMRKKLEELGIPAWGAKPLLVKRHTEWVNLWNANCDSSQPRTKRQLLADLDTWERTQGGKAPNNTVQTNGIMKKDFDGVEWASRNKDDFSRLIADARRKRNIPTSAAAGEDGVKEDSSATINADESRVHPSSDSADSTAPYAQHPEALAAVREKVEAINNGKNIEPVSNVGFASNANITTSYDAANTIPPSTQTPSSQHHRPPPALPLSGSQNTALLEQSHFGNDGRQNERTSSSQRPSVDDRPAHMGLGSSPRKVPMFAVPRDPITDTDGGGGGGPAAQ